MKAIWEWLNGNKMTIGAFILGFLAVSVEQGILDPTTFFYQALFWIGTVLGGGGLVHKFAKPKNANS